MQTAPAVFYEDTARHMTVATHKQAVERAIQVMHTHMQKVLTLEDLASVAYLSSSRFKHVFRHLIGIPLEEVFFFSTCYDGQVRACKEIR